MFLALRELRYARLRYLLIGAIIALIAALVFVLSGLANGLAHDNAAALNAMPASAIVFQQGSQLLPQYSSLPAGIVRDVSQVPGVTAATPLGQSTITVQPAAGDRQAATMFGIDPAGFLAPSVVAGKPLDVTSANGVVIDRSLTKHGIQLGDTLTLQPSGVTVKVIGLTEGRTYSHMPVIYAPLELWQRVQPAAAGKISAVVIQGSSGAGSRIVSAVPGVEAGTLDQVIQKVPGYSQETGTLTMIQLFLVGIAALIVAAFFYVLTLQKTAQFGVLKVLGATTGVLGRDLLGQVLLLTIGGVVAGAAVTLAIAQVIPGDVPFRLAQSLVAIYGAILLGVALIGALLSLRRIATIDPLTAIGRAD